MGYRWIHISPMRSYKFDGNASSNQFFQVGLRAYYILIGSSGVLQVSVKSKDANVTGSKIVVGLVNALVRQDDPANTYIQTDSSGNATNVAGVTFDDTWGAITKPVIVQSQFSAVSTVAPGASVACAISVSYDNTHTGPMGIEMAIDLLIRDGSTLSARDDLAAYHGRYGTGSAANGGQPTRVGRASTRPTRVGHASTPILDSVDIHRRRLSLATGD